MQEVARNTRSCQKVAEQLVESPKYKRLSKYKMRRHRWKIGKIFKRIKTVVFENLLTEQFFKVHFMVCNV